MQTNHPATLTTTPPQPSNGTPVHRPDTHLHPTSAHRHAANPTPRPVQQLTIQIHDGTHLSYRYFPAASPSRQTILLIHRGHEHSGRMIDLANRLNLPDAHLIGWDQRGHGASPGPRGHAPSFGAIVRDLDSFVHAVSQRHDLPIDGMSIVAHSVGAVTAAAWVHDYNPPIRAMVLAAPALRVKLYVPLAIPSLRLLRLLRPAANIRSYVKGSMLTHDPDLARSYHTDPLVSRNIALNILLDLHDASRRLLDDADAITIPTLILTAGSDYVVSNAEPRRFFDHLSSPVKQLKHYPGMFHALYHERDRHLPIADTRAFLLTHSISAPAPAADRPPQPRPAHQQRYEQLTRPAPLHQRPRWLLQRAFLSTLCRLSQGIRIGYSDGFDSGRSLDHVYRNTPQGITPLGRLIDRIYLSAPGWRGIRRRKRHIDQLLTEAIRLTLDAHSAAHILDIASGPGRYLLDVIADHPCVHVTATLRDRDQAGLAAGRSLADSMNLTHRVRYETGDAFDEYPLAALKPTPDIAVVSGLYELFPDNHLIARSLRGLHAALRPAGLLLYTNQPWHPQLDTIARTLPNREHQPWVMRCRSQDEIDRLVASAGFAKLRTLADDDGIFTVSLARRINP